MIFCTPSLSCVNSFYPRSAQVPYTVRTLWTRRWNITTNFPLLSPLPCPPAPFKGAAEISSAWFLRWVYWCVAIGTVDVLFFTDFESSLLKCLLPLETYLVHIFHIDDLIHCFIFMVSEEMSCYLCWLQRYQKR